VLPDILVVIEDEDEQAVEVRPDGVGETPGSTRIFY
jgi:hypothetical protein